MPLIGTGINANQVRTAPSGHVWIAPYGTALPVDPTTAMATVSASYKDLGYTSTDGVTITPNVTTNDFFAWQALAPVKTTLTAVDFEVKFTLEQINQTTVGLYFFGGTYSNPATGVSKLHVTSSPTILAYTLVVDYSDDASQSNRLVVNKVLLSARDALQLQRAGLTQLGMTMKAQDDSGNFFDMYSNDTQLLSS